MSTYAIWFNDLNNQAAELNRVGRKISGYESQLLSIAQGMDSTMSSIRAQVNTTATKIQSLSNSISGQVNTMDDAGIIYSSAEKTLCAKMADAVGVEDC
jgi:translation initiation factor 6 (eIF-6)